MSWRDKLSSLPDERIGQKCPQEPAATEIVFEFLRDELCPRFKALQDDFAEHGFHATSTPVTWEDVTVQQFIVTLSVQSTPTSYDRCYIECCRREGFDIAVELYPKSGHRVFSRFRIDREIFAPEEPVCILLDVYLNQLQDEFITVQPS